MMTNQFQHMVMAQQPYAATQQGYFPTDSPPLMEQFEIDMDGGNALDSTSAAIDSSSPSTSANLDSLRPQRRV